MKDRVSLYPGRVKLTPVAGQENTFDLVRADQPTDPGTELSKKNLLQDSTEISLFGSAANRTVDEAFAGIAGLLNLIKADMAAITLTVQDTNGKPIPEVLVQGILSESGQDVYTNANGVASGVIGEGNSTIGISNYADISDYSETISVKKGTIITKTITVTTRNFLKILSSQNLRFSANVETVDVSVCSGGGSGAQSQTAEKNIIGGGGGGHTKKTTGIVPAARQIYNAIVGAGGKSVSSPSGSSGVNGVDGGKSSFMGVSADSGKGGKFTTTSTPSPSGEGNGNGGYVRYGNAVNGTNGTESIYKSYTEMETCGGGGGSVGEWNESYIRSAPGRPGGGKGDTGGFGSNVEPGVDGIGGGGGAAMDTSSGKGGNGSIAIRMHLKSAA